MTLTAAVFSDCASAAEINCVGKWGEWGDDAIFYMTSSRDDSQLTWMEANQIFSHVVKVPAYGFFRFRPGMTEAQMAPLLRGRIMEIDSDRRNRFPSGRRPTPATCTSVLIKGAIEPGDGARFAAFLRANHPFLDSVFLWSPGGLVEEALKIGRLIRTAMLTTEAPDGEVPHGQPTEGAGQLDWGKICKGPSCHCASACFVIWAAGMRRYGDVLGLHRPSLRSTSFANLPPGQASELYRALLTEVETYLLEMEVPRRYIEIMMNTSSNAVYWIRDSNDPSVSSISEKVPSIEEWLAAACGTTDELDGVVVALQMKENLSQREKLELEQLKRKSLDRSLEIDKCESKKIDNSRDAIGEIK